MIGDARIDAPSGNPARLRRLVKEFGDNRFRNSYFARQLKVFLAAQFRALRGDFTQAQFGELIDKPQSVVSRLERESYGKVNLQTLIDIAQKLDIALVIRFVNYPTFVRWTNDYSAEALKPSPYKQEDMDALLNPPAPVSIRDRIDTPFTGVAALTPPATEDRFKSGELSERNQPRLGIGQERKPSPPPPLEILPLCERAAARV